MDVPLQPEREAQVAEIAAHRGLKTDELRREVLSRYREDDQHFIEAVNVGFAAAERGDFLEHEDVGKKLNQILRS